MKRKISLLLAILMLVTFIPTAFAKAEIVDAKKTSQKITLDGENVEMGAYNIQGHNYVKLRDVAAIMNGKKTQFGVGYDAEKKLVLLETQKPYEKQDGDLTEIKVEKAKAKLEVKKILVNGEEKDFKAALINENNYIQLRDLGKLVNFGVNYDEASRTILLSSEVKEEKAPRYVMIKSKLYKDTEEINKNMKCGTMDGKILTSVDAKEMPKKDNESNFGTGYEYQIGTDGSITVEINNECYIFKEVKEEKKDEDKKEEKKEEEKKEEKKDEGKEENVKVVKTDNFDELEKAKLDAIVKLHDMYAKYTKDDYIVGKNIILDAIPFSEYMSTLKNMAKFLGSDLYLEDRGIKKRIEEIDGKKYYVVEFDYGNGSFVIEKLPVEQSDENIKMPTIAQILALIPKDIEKASIIEKGAEFIDAKVKEFHDALADKDFKKAVEALKALNFKATEENVKKTLELRLKNAKDLGAEILSKDYTIESKEENGGRIYTFKYKNGAKFEIFIGGPFPGLGTFVLPKDK